MVSELNTEGVAVNLACDTLEVSRSGYYVWLTRPESERAKENAILLAHIRAIHEKSKQTYGSPRMTKELNGEGLACGEKRVARIMRENEIASEAVRKFKMTTTDSNHDLPIATRVFQTENADAVMAPNQVWTGDITFIPTDEGWRLKSAGQRFITGRDVQLVMKDSTDILIRLRGSLLRFKWYAKVMT